MGPLTPLHADIFASLQNSTEKCYCPLGARAQHEIPVTAFVVAAFL